MSGKKQEKEIRVTKTYLPDMGKYRALLEDIWQSGQVTNGGPLSRRLEQSLAAFLDVDYFSWVTNGTVALQIAIRALELKGSIITTPFTYVATANSIIWENCTPVFVDIAEGGYNISPSAIEPALRSDTSAVLAVHTYGYPCDVESLREICNRHGLKLIYDAAHAFGVRIGDRSLASFGDMATLSFHATKVYHTIEGGGIICSSKEIWERVHLYRTFGHRYDDYLQVGINAKNSEFHAGIGLLNLDIFEEVREGRKAVFDHYHDRLAHGSLRLISPDDFERLEYNYGYMVVEFDLEEELMEVVDRLNRADIFPRRYFYPSLNTLPYLNETKCPRSEEVAKKVLCLPLYHELPLSEVDRICDIVLAILS